jgi:hypothetical protein
MPPYVGGMGMSPYVGGVGMPPYVGGVGMPPNMGMPIVGRQSFADYRRETKSAAAWSSTSRTTASVSGAFHANGCRAIGVSVCVV